MALAIEVDQFGIHRSYAQVIPSADHIELQAFFNKHIDKCASIRTNEWTGYLPLKQEYQGLVAEPSSTKGKAFPLLHRQVMMLKHG